MVRMNFEILKFWFTHNVISLNKLCQVDSCVPFVSHDTHLGVSHDTHLGEKFIKNQHPYFVGNSANKWLIANIKPSSIYSISYISLKFSPIASILSIRSFELLMFFSMVHDPFLRNFSCQWNFMSLASELLLKTFSRIV